MKKKVEITSDIVFNDALRWNNKILIDYLHAGTMRVKPRHETDRTFFLYVATVSIKICLSHE